MQKKFEILLFLLYFCSSALCFEENEARKKANQTKYVIRVNASSDINRKNLIFKTIETKKPIFVGRYHNKNLEIWNHTALNKTNVSSDKSNENFLKRIYRNFKKLFQGDLAFMQLAPKRIVDDEEKLNKKEKLKKENKTTKISKKK